MSAWLTFSLTFTMQIKSDGENAEALSIRHLAAEQKCAVADLLQGLTLYNNSNDKDGFARARLLLQVIKAMGL